MKTLVENTLVIFDLNGFQGAGVICGKTGRGNYLVRIQTEPKQGYSYSCIVVPFKNLKVFGPEDTLTPRDKVSLVAGHIITDAEWERWLNFCAEDPYGDGRSREEPLQ